MKFRCINIAKKAIKRSIKITESVFLSVIVIFSLTSLISCNKAENGQLSYGDIIETVTAAKSDKETVNATTAENTAKSNDSDTGSNSDNDSNTDDDSKDGGNSDTASKGNGNTANDSAGKDAAAGGSSYAATDNAGTDNTDTAVRLNVSCIMQMPELPAGCEATSLTIVLNYLGFDADKCDVAGYLTCVPVSSGSMYEAFVGSPFYDSGYGCYAPPLVECARKYALANDYSYNVTNVSYSSFDTLLSYVNNGNPIIIWATEQVMEPEVAYTWEYNGTTQEWLRPQHCLVLTGFDKANNLVYVADPMMGNVSYPLDVFELRYTQMYSQAVLVTR